jgi:hypothetical protein
MPDLEIVESEVLHVNPLNEWFSNEGKEDLEVKGGSARRKKQSARGKEQRVTDGTSLIRKSR